MFLNNKYVLMLNIQRIDYVVNGLLNHNDNCQTYNNLFYQGYCINNNLYKKR